MASDMSRLADTSPAASTDTLQLLTAVLSSSSLRQLKSGERSCQRARRQQATSTYNAIRRPLLTYITSMLPHDAASTAAEHGEGSICCE